MSDMPSTPIREQDYEAIEAAVMETARGRWFLAEYAKRNRTADTRVLLDAIARLETVVKRERSIDDVDTLRLELIDMKTAIERTKQEIADLRAETDEQGPVNEATAELDAIVEQTEQATQDILSAAEAIQEIAWTFRESDAQTPLCDRLDNHSTEIYTACSFQDLTGQRIKKVVDVLRYLENHVNRMIDIWGIEDIDGDFARPAPPKDNRPDAHLLNGPQLTGNGIDQTDVDELFETAIIAGNTMPADDLVDNEIDWDQADVFAPKTDESVTADQAVEPESFDPAREIDDFEQDRISDQAEPDAPVLSDDGDFGVSGIADDAITDSASVDDAPEGTPETQPNDWNAAAIAAEFEEACDDPGDKMTMGERLSLFS